MRLIYDDLVNGVHGEDPMLIEMAEEAGAYVIGVNNASDAAELISDFSLIGDVQPGGEVVFDFRHMGMSLTQERRDEFTPGSVGYQPTKQLVEVVAAIARYAEQDAIPTHRFVAVLPKDTSKVGGFLRAMRLREVLEAFHIEVRSATAAFDEFGDDDARENIVPLTDIRLGLGGKPHFPTLRKLYEGIAAAFTRALPAQPDVAALFTQAVSEGVENMTEYGGGGIIAGLYYPRVGEVR